MSLTSCLAGLKAGGIADPVPGDVSFAKAQIARGLSLLASRQPGGRELHFVELRGTAVLAVWDAADQIVIAFLRVHADPRRLQAFVAGMLASHQRTVQASHAARIADAIQAEHDGLVREAREAGGWTGQMVAAWAGVCARDGGLSLPCPFDAEAEPDLARRWRAAYSKGRDALVPAAEIARLAVTGHPWAPRPGTTHAALCAIDS